MQEAVAPDFNWLEVASSLGFAGMAWFLIVFALPRMLKEEREARERSSDQFAATLRSEHDAFDKNLQRIADSFEKQQALHRETVAMVLERIVGQTKRQDRTVT